MDQTTYNREAAIREILTATIVDEGHTCGICLELYYESVETPSEGTQEHTPVTLQCGHIFGQGCITEWLTANMSCPTCRARVLSVPRRRIMSPGEMTLESCKYISEPLLPLQALDLVIFETCLMT